MFFWPFKFFSQDMLDAYKEKLAFLNEEIVSQNGLRFVMGAREETLMAALGEWEAKYARLESRHLFSLKEIAAETRKRPGRITDLETF